MRPKPRWSWIALLVTAAAGWLLPAAHADRIRLQAGNVLQGYVTGESADELTVCLPSGIETHVARADVAAIEEEKDAARLREAAAGFVARQRYRVAAALYRRLGSDAEAASLRTLCEALDQAQAAGRQEDYAGALEKLSALPPELAEHAAVAAFRSSLDEAQAEVRRKIDVAILTRSYGEAARLLGRREFAADPELRRRALRLYQDQGDLHFFRESWDPAIAAYESVLKVDAEARDARLRLAYCRARKLLESGGGQVEAGLKEILEFEPELQIAHRHLGRAAYERGDKAQAAVHFSALLQVARDLPATIERIPEDVEELKYLSTRVAVKPMLDRESAPLLPRATSGGEKWQQRETPWFTIYYRDSATASATAQAIDLYLKALGEQLLGPGVTWTPQRKRPLYLYRSPEDRTGDEPPPGMHNFGIAANALGLLGEGDALIADALPHDLAHLIAGERQWMLPIWASEGVALVAQRSERLYDAYYQVQRAIDDGREVPMDELLGISAMAGKDAAYYQVFSLQSWTVLDYLLDRKGGILNFHRYLNVVLDRFRVKARRAAESKRYEDPANPTVQVQVDIDLKISYGALREVYSLGEIKSFAKDWREYVARVTRGEVAK